MPAASRTTTVASASPARFAAVREHPRTRAAKVLCTSAAACTATAIWIPRSTIGAIRSRASRCVALSDSNLNEGDEHDQASGDGICGPPRGRGGRLRLRHAEGRDDEEGGDDEK